MPVLMHTESRSLIEQADRAMSKGDLARAASLLDVAAQRGRDAAVLLRLATVRRAIGDLSGAAAAALAGLELAPRNFLMGLLLGSLRESTGAIHGALRAYRAALRFAPNEVPFQPGIEAQLRHARACVAAEDDWHRRLYDWDSGTLNGRLPDGAARRIRGFRANLLDHLDTGPLTLPKFVIPGLPLREFFDSGEFDGIDRVAACTDAMRDEFLALVELKKGEFGSRMTGLHESADAEQASGRWSMIPLVRNGRPVAEMADLCPATLDAIGGLAMPRLGMISPSVYFSTLEPGTHIPAHTGITNARAIAHFPLIVPAACRFRVGSEMREWRVGEPMVFDDMTMHEAWNDGSGLRVVLIVDLWRPELGAEERKAVEELMRLEVETR